MDISGIVWIALLASVFVIALFFIGFSMRASRVNLTQTDNLDEKPRWMATTPPQETLAATRADGEGISVYDYDPGERLAAPFAEQIEDIVHAKLQAENMLTDYEVDLGTAPDGGLEIWVNGELYTNVAALPSTRLREIFQESLEKWNAKSG